MPINFSQIFLNLFLQMASFLLHHQVFIKITIQITENEAKTTNRKKKKKHFQMKHEMFSLLNVQSKLLNSKHVNRKRVLTVLFFVEPHTVLHVNLLAGSSQSHSDPAEFTNINKSDCLVWFLRFWRSSSFAITITSLSTPFQKTL